MASERMNEQLNLQIAQELTAAYYYLALSAFSESKNFSGAGKFFRMQFDEELGHAMKLFDYVLKRPSCEVKLHGLEEPVVQCNTLLDAFEIALGKEKETTQSIYRLMDLATEEHDYATLTMLNWFAEEQAEEEATMQYFTDRLQMVGEDGTGLLMVDSELGQRQPDAAAE